MIQINLQIKKYLKWQQKLHGYELGLWYGSSFYNINPSPTLIHSFWLIHKSIFKNNSDWAICKIYTFLIETKSSESPAGN